MNQQRILGSQVDTVAISNNCTPKKYSQDEANHSVSPTAVTESSSPENVEEEAEENDFDFAIRKLRELTAKEEEYLQLKNAKKLNLDWLFRTAKQVEEDRDVLQERIGIYHQEKFCLFVLELTCKLVKIALIEKQIDFLASNVDKIVKTMESSLQLISEKERVSFIQNYHTICCYQGIVHFQNLQSSKGITKNNFDQLNQIWSQFSSHLKQLPADKAKAPWLTSAAVVIKGEHDKFKVTCTSLMSEIRTGHHEVVRNLCRLRIRSNPPAAVTPSSTNVATNSATSQNDISIKSN